MEIKENIFSRAELLLGSDVMEEIGRKSVIIFGVGGVGSWCAESLVRSGVKRLTMVDMDEVCVTNVNRQLMATVHTVGQVKVDALRQRLLDINPEAEITALRKVYCAETADDFDLDSYDYVVDAIDSLADKALLIRRACETRAVLFSSMGAALKMDPTKVSVAEFWKVQGCPLAAALRRRFKKSGLFPKRKFKCVYSGELLKNVGRTDLCDAKESPCVSAEETTGAFSLSNGGRGGVKSLPNGTMAHITAIFGFTIAGLIMQDIWEKSVAVAKA